MGAAAAAFAAGERGIEAATARLGALLGRFTAAAA